MFSLVNLLPLLHTGGPEPTGPTYSHWVLDPKIALYVFGITALYLLWVGPLNRRRPGIEERPVEPRQIRWFLAGSVFALIALGPPIDDWSDWFFASVHMFQHLLLILVVVPCWLAGIPAWVYRPIFANRWTSVVFRTLVHPVVAFVLASMIMVLWHLPIIYDAALTNDMIHAVEHQFFLFTGFLIWWPVMSKVPEAPALKTPLNCMYLFVLMIPSGMVGAFITLAGTGLYSGYADASVRPFGLDLKNDQEIAGLLMWVGMNFVFVVVISILFLRWATQQEKADLEATRIHSRASRTLPVTGGATLSTTDRQP